MTSTRPQNRRQRGVYGSKADERHAQHGPGFRPRAAEHFQKKIRPDGPYPYKARLADFVGRQPGQPNSGRSASHTLSYSNGSLTVTKQAWTPITAEEFERLRDEAIEVANYRDENGIGFRRVKRKFLFQDADGADVELPELADVPAHEAA